MKPPMIRLSEAELTTGELDPTTYLLASQAFSSQGCLLVENALSTEFVACLRERFVNRYEHRLLEADETVEVGDQRIMTSLELAGPFSSPTLYANPLILPLVQGALGSDCILGSLGAVAALPGADDQHIHRDHPFLFEDEAIDTAALPFAVNVLIPLIDLNELHGRTRVWPGSHRIWSQEAALREPYADPVAPVGSCMLMDYRLVHSGTTNRSSTTRPILYVIYHRPWFHDYVNFQRVKPLRISADEYSKVPTEYKHWFGSYVE
ncbi:MAG: phytanoyl-CoA dioxygenase [bacterium]|nr:phytanoyl-CoA dioxygenase [bacterium]